MLVAAFLAVVFSVQTGSPWGGLLAAIAGGALLGAVHALFAVKLKADQIVSGIAMILLGLGLSGYGYRLTLGAAGRSVQIAGFDQLDVLGLAGLPFIGPKGPAAANGSTDYPRRSADRFSRTAL